MIYILVGNDNIKKKDYIKGLTGGSESFFVTSNILNKELIMNYSSGANLFGEIESIILDNVLSSGEINFSDEELEILASSENIFIFREDKMLALSQKKFKKYGKVEIFEEKSKTSIEKFNVFSITDAFASKDKINTWVLYHKAINSGVEPEAIAGVLFWKIKSLILNGSKFFSKNDLRKQSATIVSIYHRAHRGELDFNVGLEQFILNFLSSK